MKDSKTSLARPRRWQSLRTKFTIQTVISISGLVVMVALITVTLVALHLYDAARSQTSAFYANLVSVYKTSPRVVLQYTRAADPHIWVFRHRHLLIRSPNTLPYPPGPLATRLLTHPYLTWRLSRYADGRHWVIDWPLGPDLDVIRDLMIVSATVTLGASAAGALLGRRTTHRVLEPVAAMSRTVEAMLDRQQYRPIPPPSPRHDEFTELASVLSHLITTLEDRRQRERLLLAEAAHQLRTPLEVIRGNVDILIDWEHIDPDTEHDTLLAIKRASEDMTTLVQNLLTLENARNYPQQLVRLDLRELVEEVAEDAKAIGSEHQITASLPSPPAIVDGDLAAARRALWAVMENALKYAPPGTEISLRLESKHRRWMIAVVNTASPIPADELPRLFDRFYRGRQTRTTAGSGLGLAIAKALMENQKGGIFADSSERDTTFTLWWPV